MVIYIEGEIKIITERTESIQWLPLAYAPKGKYIGKVVKTKGELELVERSLRYLIDRTLKFDPNYNALLNNCKDYC
jgi:hypothetical protein